MASNAFSGVGTLFQRSDMASSPTFSTVAEVNSVAGPTMSQETIDVTSLDSTGGYREFIAGFKDGGTVTLSMNFTLDAYDDFLIAFDAGTAIDYQIVLPDTGNTTFSFSAIVTELPVDIPTDDKVTASVTLKISGQVTLAS